MSQNAKDNPDKSSPSVLNLRNQSGDVTRIGYDELIDEDQKKLREVGEGLSQLFPDEDYSHVKLHLDEIFAEAAKKVCEKTSTQVIPESEDDPELWSSDPDSDSDSQISENDSSGYDSERGRPSSIQFIRLIKDLSDICHKIPELTLNSSMIFKDVYPNKLTLYECAPTKITLKRLQRLSIFPPSTLHHLKSTDMKKYFRFVVGDNKDALSCEEQLRDRVLFFLNSLRAPNLREFVMKCIEDGKEMCQYSCRYSIWEASLIKFLRYHSSHLTHINIETCRTPGTLLSHKTVPLQVGTQKVFPNLEELSLVFWEREPCETSLKTQQLKLTPYWSELVKSRIYHVGLKKLIWMSQEALPWSEVFAPLIRNNRETLETIHVIEMDNNLPCNNEDHLNNNEPLTKLDAAIFSDVPHLKNLFLRIKRCYGVQMHLLPEQLEELCLDNIWVLSADLLSAVQKLPYLRKLKLVENTPTKSNETVPTEQFGLNEDIFRNILNLRKLEEFTVRGFSINQTQPQAQAVLMPSASAALSSTALALGGYIKRFLGIGNEKRVMPVGCEDSEFGFDNAKSHSENLSFHLLESVGEIALLNDEQITIG